jgi:hypothetical protein
MIDRRIPDCDVITPEIAHYIAVKQTLALPLSKKYSSPELRELAEKQNKLFAELLAVEKRIKELCEEQYQNEKRIKELCEEQYQNENTPGR